MSDDKIRKDFIPQNIMRRLAGIPEKSIRKYIEEEIEKIKNWRYAKNSPLSNVVIFKDYEFVKKHRNEISYFRELVDDTLNGLNKKFDPEFIDLSKAKLLQYVEFIMARGRYNTLLGAFSYFIRYPYVVLLYEYFLSRNSKKGKPFEDMGRFDIDSMISPYQWFSCFFLMDDQKRNRIFIEYKFGEFWDDCIKLQLYYNNKQLQKDQEFSFSQIQNNVMATFNDYHSKLSITSEELPHKIGRKAEIHVEHYRRLLEIIQEKKKNGEKIYPTRIAKDVSVEFGQKETTIEGSFYRVKPFLPKKYKGQSFREVMLQLTEKELEDAFRKK